MDSMNIQKYKMLVQTVDCGSFTKAAELLGYSQSAVSKMIDDLEKEWSVSLLERNRNNIKPTSEGIKLLPYARKVCDDYENLKTAINEINGLQSGLIRIGTISSVATHWLPKIIKKFQKDYPNIEYEILLGDYYEMDKWISEGKIDCGFFVGPATKNMSVTVLAKDKLLAVLPKNHRLASNEKFPVSELCKDSFLLLEQGGKCEVREFLDNNNIVPQIHFTTWDDYAIMSMVENGLGISILPELILKRNPYEIITKEFDVPAFREIYFATKKDTPLSKAVQKFMEYLIYRD